MLILLLRTSENNCDLRAEPQSLL